MKRALGSHLVAFLVVLVLLALTAIGAFLPLGYGNLTLSLGISALKAAIVFLYFMELKREDNLIRMAALVGLIWLGIFLMLAGTDYLSRWPGHHS